MTAHNERVIILNGFAGPGEYMGGEPGSPIIAIDTLLSHSYAGLRSHEVEFLFIEKDPERCEHLKLLLASRALPPTVHYQVACGEFNDTLSSLLQILEDRETRLAPTFAFIDPFGYSDTPMKTIARLMAHPKCETLITFMHEEINRFLSFENAANEAHYDNLFGTTTWRDIIAQPLEPKERERRIHDLYQRQLTTNGGAKYVRSFRMRNKSNRTDYFLFFGTTNLKGLDKMKEAMWKVDPSGSYDFSDLTDPSQPVLFSATPNFDLLKALLQNKFRGTTTTVDAIQEFVVAETAFYSGQYKTNVLKPMEASGEISAVGANPTRRAGTYGDPHLRLHFN